MVMMMMMMMMMLMMMYVGIGEFTTDEITIKRWMERRGRGRGVCVFGL
jgi:hypothetical protein